MFFETHFQLITKSIICLIVYILLLPSCSNQPSSSNPESYLNSKLALSKDICELSSARQRILVFLDLRDCASCQIKEMQFWDDFLYAFGHQKDADCVDADMIFVVNVSETEELTELFAQKNDICPIKVYYDSEDAFKSKNLLPDEHQYHCFLIDSRNRIELIGKPIFNSELFDKYLTAL